MRVTVDYARRLIADQKCDQLIAFDERRNKIGQWSGAEEITAALEDLVNDTDGFFVVKVWKKPTNKGRFRIDEKAFVLTLRGGGQKEGVNGHARNGSDQLMREMFDLRLKLKEIEIKSKYEDRTERLLETYGPWLQDVIDRVLPDNDVNGRIGDRTEDIEAEVVGERRQAPPKKPSPLNDEIKEVLGLVIQLYKKDPDMVRRFVPALKAQL